MKSDPKPRTCLVCLQKGKSEKESTFNSSGPGNRVCPDHAASNDRKQYERVYSAGKDGSLTGQVVKKGLDV